VRLAELGAACNDELSSLFDNPDEFVVVNALADDSECRLTGDVELE